LSNTLDAGFCVDALKVALRKYGKPKFFNTNQGCPFASYDFTGVLKDAKVNTSTDGRPLHGQHFYRMIVAVLKIRSRLSA